MKERIHKKQRVIQQITRQQLYSSIITKQYALNNSNKTDFYTTLISSTNTQKLQHSR